jgi:hypothetical protein
MGSRRILLRSADGERPQLTAEEVAIRKVRRLEAMNLQAIEGNPLDAEDIAMFEMFEREAWPDEKCREYILARVEDIAEKGQS